MEHYSHEAFTVSGYVSHVTGKKTMMTEIKNAWRAFMQPGMSEKISNKLHPSLHCVYYDYKNVGTNEFSFTFCIGYITDPHAAQTNPDIVTITVPAQNYMYKTMKGHPHETVPKLWDEINASSHEEVPRTFAYDLEMYNEAGDEVTIAVSV